MTDDDCDLHEAVYDHYIMLMAVVMFGDVNEDTVQKITTIPSFESIKLGREEAGEGGLRADTEIMLFEPDTHIHDRTIAAMNTGLRNSLSYPATASHTPRDKD